MPTLTAWTVDANPHVSRPVVGDCRQVCWGVRLYLLLLVLVGCTAGDAWTGYVGEDSWSTLPQTPLQLRVSKFDRTHPGTITAVGLPPIASEAPTGPAVEGTRLDLSIQGVACVLVVEARVSEQVEKWRSDKERRRAPSASAGTREMRGLVVSVTCPGQALPGTDASQLGARSRTGTLWAALFLVLGVAAGALARRAKDEDIAGLGLGAVIAIAGAVFGYVMFQGLFCLTYAILVAAHGLAGIFAMRADSRWLRVAAIGGLAIGTAIAPLLWPLWSGFGPICALLFGAGVAVIGLVVVVSLED